jgi:hypothetical protein
MGSSGARGKPGMELKIPSLLEALNTLYQYWIHTELIDRIGLLECVPNTASHHRVHRGTNVVRRLSLTRVKICNRCLHELALHTEADRTLALDGVVA